MHSAAVRVMHSDSLHVCTSWSTPPHTHTHPHPIHPLPPLHTHTHSPLSTPTPTHTPTHTHPYPHSPLSIHTHTHTGGSSPGPESGEGDAPEDPERVGRADQSCQHPSGGHSLPGQPQTENSGRQEDADRREEGNRLHYT